MAACDLLSRNTFVSTSRDKLLSIFKCIVNKCQKYNNDSDCYDTLASGYCSRNEYCLGTGISVNLPRDIRL